MTKRNVPHTRRRRRNHNPDEVTDKGVNETTRAATPEKKASENGIGRTKGGDMSAKKQMCLSCAGDCCSIVSFVNTRNSGTTFSMDMRYADLRELGYEEIVRQHAPCTQKTKDACFIYETRPLLCRTYYCHGKLWQPK